MIFILVVFEILSIIAATFIYFFGSWRQICNKNNHRDEVDFVVVSFFIAALLGWCTFPVFVYAVYKTIKSM